MSSPTSLQPLTKQQVIEEELAEITRHREQCHPSQSTEQIQETLSALCLSGGGIRSATFNLGILQALAKHKLLDKFDYLSTVSGGGYIGSWLTAWIHRESLTTVQGKLTPPPQGSPNREATPISWLRGYAQYLAPRTGYFSADTWTVFSTYLRNLFLNWLVLLPAIASIILINKLIESFLRSGENGFPAVFFLTFCSAPLLALSIAKPENLNKFIRSKPFIFLAIVISLFALLYPYSTYKRAGFEGGLFLLLLSAVFGAIVVGNTSFHLPTRRKTYSPQGPNHSQVIRECLIPLLWASVLLTTGWRMLPDTLEGWKLATIFFLYGVSFNVVGLWMLRPFRKWRLKVRAYPPLSKCFERVISTILFGILPGSLLFLGASSFDRYLHANTNLLVSLGIPYGMFAYWVGVSFLTGWLHEWTTDEDREWWARLGGRILLISVTWGLFSIATTVVPPLILTSNNLQDVFPFLLSITGLTSLGFSTAETNALKGRESGRIKTLFLALLPKYSAPLFLLGLLASLSTLITKAATVTLAFFTPMPWANPIIGYLATTEGKSVALFLLTIGSAAFSYKLSSKIGINTFSMHAMYRDRLSTAYLGASRKASERGITSDSFTGQDYYGDDLEIGTLHHRPLHVLNSSLNLVNGDNLSWQERKAQSFTLSPLHCGSWNLGTNGSYQAIVQNSKNQVWLSAAMAISAAAGNPNMGNRSSGPLTAIMAIFNVRLGWWAGNPKTGTPVAREPRSALIPYLREVAGLTNDSYKFINLSDGGHFENLGLYEMVLRRCRYIVVCDAEEDPEHTFDGLARAIRHVQVDFGISIEIDLSSIRPQSPSQQSYAHATIGTIHYSDADGNTAPSGHLLYIKASLTGDEPEDVKSYKQLHPAFPHEPTANQFFVESQFESYRKLGIHIGDTVLRQLGSNGNNQLHELLEG